MSEEFIGCLGTLLIVAILSIGGYEIYSSGYTDGLKVGKVLGYEHGQIDAINGHVNYELKIQPDKTAVWVKIDPDPKEAHDVR